MALDLLAGGYQPGSCPSAYGDDMMLNLGSGTDKKKGWVNVDIEGNPDMKHDLDSYPWPFPDNSATMIRMHHVLEHLDSPIRAIEECCRVLHPEGILDIEVPYGATTISHPWHKHDFLPKWFTTLCTRDSPSMNPWRDKTNLKLQSLKTKRGDHAFWRKYEIRAIMVKQ